MKKLIFCLAVLTIFAPKSLLAMMEWYDLNTQTVHTISTDTPGLHGYVDVSGTWMTWTRDWYINPANGLDIVACDLTTGTIYDLTNAPGDQRGGAISGTKVIWTDNMRSPGICGYDLSTMQPFYYVIDGAYGNDMAISGNNVAYIRNIDGNIGLSVFNMGIQANIDTIVPASVCYVIGGNLLTYSDLSGFLKAKNIVTGETYSDIGYGWNGLSTDGNNIVWWETTTDGFAKLWSYDVASGNKTNILTDYNSGFWDSTTDVDNGRVVYTYYGSIYMYDLTSHQTSLIRERWFAEGGTAINYTSPRISGDIIVWDPPPVTVPEPATLALFTIGLLGMIRRIRRC